MLSQADVARKAGVSIMTVSRVINDAQNVRPETREKVLQAIRELSYYPNAAARALNRNRANVLEILIPHEDYFYSSEYFSELIFGIEKVVHDSEYNLIFNTYDPGSGAEYALLYKQRKVDGLLIVAPASTDRTIVKLQEESVPFVLINGRVDDLEVSFVDVDNVAGAFLAVRYLRKPAGPQCTAPSGGVSRFPVGALYYRIRPMDIQRQLVRGQRLRRILPSCES
jgi:DNA-binding LacI/PurR family transcriptional regulator